MSRSGVVRLCAAIVLGLFATAGVSARDAEARATKKKKKAAAAKVEYTANANVKALSELMGPYKFGMSKTDILKVLAQEIGDRYKEKIEATTDVYVQDKLRRDRQAELDRVKNSYVEFKGTVKTGWDVSIVDTEFARDTDEAMMVYWENSADTHKDQRRFFFFHNAHLYKMFIALNSSTLKDEQKNFAFFQGLMEARYGKGKVIQDANGQRVEWRTKDYRVAAIDKLNFYGSFCLMIADPGEEAQVAEVRASNKKEAKPNAVMQSVLQGKDNGDNPGLDDNKAAVDAVLKGN